jgi:hypothetical protein
MRYAVLSLMAVAACGDPESPATRSTLQTNATTYVASPAGIQGFDYAVTIEVTLHNTSAWVVRLPRCTATTTWPDYAVEFQGSGGSAWTPNVTCSVSRVPYVDVMPGATHSETIVLTAPWQRLFNGQPVGAIEGSFSLVLGTQLCPQLSPTGLCLPSPPEQEYVRSNTFTVTR